MFPETHDPRGLVEKISVLGRSLAGVGTQDLGKQDGAVKLLSSIGVKSRSVG